MSISQPLMVVAHTDMIYPCVVSPELRRYDKPSEWQRLAAKHLQSGGRMLQLRSPKGSHTLEMVLDELTLIRDGASAEELEYEVMAEYADLDSFLDVKV